MPKSAWEFDYKRMHYRAQTASIQFGSLMHRSVLESKKFDQNYFVAKKLKRNIEEGKKILAMPKTLLVLVGWLVH